MDISNGVKCMCNLSYLNNVLFLSLVQQSGLGWSTDKRFPYSGSLGMVHWLQSNSVEYQDMTWRVVQAIILMTSDHQLPVLPPSTNQSPLNIIMVIIRSNEDRYIQWPYTPQLEWSRLFINVIWIHSWYNHIYDQENL